MPLFKSLIDNIVVTLPVELHTEIPVEKETIAMVKVYVPKVPIPRV